MTLKEGNPRFYFQSIFQVLRNQEKHLLPLTEDLSKRLNALYAQLENPVIYSHAGDLDELAKLKDGYSEYYDFSFLEG